MSIRKRVLAVVLGALMSPWAYADQVTLKNGDRLTGSISKSDSKTLTLKYFAGTVVIPWEEVASIGSSAPLTLTLKDGQVLTGPVTTVDGKLEVQTAEAGQVTTAKEAVQTLRSKEEEAAYQAELERLRNPKLRDLWKGFLDAGLATAQGNARTTTINLGLDAARTTPRDKIGVYLTSLYASNTTTGVSLTTANAVRGGLRYDVNITDRTFGFGFTALEFDEFQSLDLRFVAGGGLGRHVIKNEKTVFDVFAGGALNKEFFSTGLNRSSGEILFGEELSHKLSTSTSLQQRFVVYPNLSDTGEYRMNWDSSAITRLSRWLSWQITISDRFLSNPVPGRKKNDVLFTTGLRFTFSGE
ncbi:MAG TPA: DUF481 domain-containing protein [Terriglobia bacterium]|nr:DUF481 domain-containing protein [Terriglobia bacterium]